MLHSVQKASYPYLYIHAYVFLLMASTINSIHLMLNQIFIYVLLYVSLSPILPLMYNMHFSVLNYDVNKALLNSSSLTWMMALFPYIMIHENAYCLYPLLLIFLILIVMCLHILLMENVHYTLINKNLLFIFYAILHHKNLLHAIFSNLLFFIKIFTLPCHFYLIISSMIML